MFLLKKISFDLTNETIKIFEINSFNFDEDLTVININKQNSPPFSAVKNYYISKESGKRKKLVISILNESTNDKAEGYMLFVSKSVIETDGEILFKKGKIKGISKSVIVLREGNYLKIFNNVITIHDNELKVS